MEIYSADQNDAVTVSKQYSHLSVCFHLLLITAYQMCHFIYLSLLFVHGITG